MELYRRSAEAVIGRTVAAVDTIDPAFVKRGAPEELEAVLPGQRVDGVRRRGKLLVLDIGDVALGLRFGMTGRLLVDGDAVIDQLEYSSSRDDAAWDRFRLGFTDGGWLAIRDPRRLGGVELDPDLSALGVDLFAVDAAALRTILDGSGRPLKARLMDQAQVAGLGNLLTDEILWRASLDPARPADSLDGRERRRLLHHLRRVPTQLLERGGSHTGDLHDERRDGGRCPKDGTMLTKRTIGGRTTYACPQHQRPL